jgi:hypothetical protein
MSSPAAARRAPRSGARLESPAPVASSWPDRFNLASAPGERCRVEQDSTPARREHLDRTHPAGARENRRPAGGGRRAARGRPAAMPDPRRPATDFPRLGAFSVVPHTTALRVWAPVAVIVEVEIGDARLHELHVGTFSAAGTSTASSPPGRPPGPRCHRIEASSCGSDAGSPTARRRSTSTRIGASSASPRRRRADRQLRRCGAGRRPRPQRRRPPVTGRTRRPARVGRALARSPRLRGGKPAHPPGAVYRARLPDRRSGRPTPGAPLALTRPAGPPRRHRSARIRPGRRVPPRALSGGPRLTRSATPGPRLGRGRREARVGRPVPPGRALRCCEPPLPRGPPWTSVSSP